MVDGCGWVPANPARASSLPQAANVLHTVRVQSVSARARAVWWRRECSAQSRATPRRASSSECDRSDTGGGCSRYTCRSAASSTGRGTWRCRRMGLGVTAEAVGAKSRSKCSDRADSTRRWHATSSPDDGTRRQSA
eukprot:scaffold33467_cov129-Isochrysis_galbana.AAC.4